VFILALGAGREQFIFNLSTSSKTWEEKEDAGKVKRRKNDPQRNRAGILEKAVLIY
jgi:hypothetical protein